MRRGGRCSSAPFIRKTWSLWLSTRLTAYKNGKCLLKIHINLLYVCSLIPESVRIMALTATTTKSIRHNIMKVLGMIKPAIITVSPNKENLKYIVTESTLEETFEGLVEEVRAKRALTDRTIVFCQIYDYCSYIYKYMYLVTCLGKEATEPVGVLMALPHCQHVHSMYTPNCQESYSGHTSKERQCTESCTCSFF